MKSTDTEKRKIIFVTSCIQPRGVEKALLGLLDYIPRSQFEITLLLVEVGGEYMDLVPEDVEVLEMAVPEQVRYDVNHGGNGKKNIKRALKQGKIVQALQIIYRKKFKGDPLGWMTTPFQKLKMQKGVYDIAVCYHSHNPFLLKYVTDKINARRKITWLHNDFYASRYDPKPYESEFCKCDRIFGVSKQVVDEFKEIFPKLASRTFLFNNIVPVVHIKQQAEVFYPEEFKVSAKKDKHILLSIGGLDYQKGFDVAIEAAAILKKRNIPFDWWILGEGGEEDHLKENIFRYDLDEDVHLIGTRKNPYPYIKNAEIYVQPSRHEGYGIAVEEARILCRPIIATDFAGAREQIVNGVTGLIVKFDRDEIADAVQKILMDVNMQKTFCENLVNDKHNEHLSEQIQLLLERL